MPFWQFFRNWLIGWIGHALLVQPSKTAPRIFFSFILKFSFILLNMKPLSEVAPGLLVIQIQIQAVCPMNIEKNKRQQAKLSKSARMSSYAKVSQEVLRWKKGAHFCPLRNVLFLCSFGLLHVFCLLSKWWLKPFWK